MTVKGKVAVVTGAGRGIGRAIAIALAAAGAKVVVADFGVAIDGSSPSQGPGNEVVDVIKTGGGEAIACFESVATMVGGERIIQAALDAYGRLDTLVCAAGIMRPATIFDMTEEDWDSVITTNLKGHFTTIKPACIEMRKQASGSIMTFTSRAGLEGDPRQPNYSASKEGIIGLTRAVALAIAPYATCNAISPSGSTRMSDLIAPPAGEKSNPPDLVAPLAVFLASDAARHITGQVLRIAGESVSRFAQPRPVRSAFQKGGWTAEGLARLWDGAIGADPLARYNLYTQSK